MMSGPVPLVYNPGSGRGEKDVDGLLARLPEGCRKRLRPVRLEPPFDFAPVIDQARAAGEPLLVWGDSNKTLRAYDKIMLDPVCMYATATNSHLARVSEADRQILVNYFDAALRRDIAPDFTLVDKPGPGVLRMRVAITEARGAHVLLDTFSTVYPIGLAVSAARALATGVHSAVGTVGIEGEVLDAQTGQRLFAAVDARVGRKFTGKFDKFKKWRTAMDAFDYWADRLHGWLRMKHVQAEGHA